MISCSADQVHVPIAQMDQRRTQASCWALPSWRTPSIASSGLPTWSSHTTTKWATSPGTRCVGNALGHSAGNKATRLQFIQWDTLLSVSEVASTFFCCAWWWEQLQCSLPWENHFWQKKRRGGGEKTIGQQTWNVCALVRKECAPSSLLMRI